MHADRLSVSVGYHLLFLPNVYRTGQQIDRRIDPGQLSPALPIGSDAGGAQTHPTALLNSSTLRAQGLTVGVSVTH